jgi:DNA-binding MarR family transcriptional regulator
MAKPRWLDERESDAWRGFVQMQTQVMSRIARETQRSTGLSAPDYEVLVNLSEAPGGRMRAFQLGAATRWEKSRLSHHLSRMADRGMVERAPCDEGARGSWVTITPAGRAAIAAAAPQHVEHVRRWFVDSLTDTQLEALAEIAEQLLATLAESPPDDPCDE